MAGASIVVLCRLLLLQRGRTSSEDAAARFLEEPLPRRHGSLLGGYPAGGVWEQRNVVGLRVPRVHPGLGDPQVHLLRERTGCAQPGSPEVHPAVGDWSPAADAGPGPR